VDLPFRPAHRGGRIGPHLALRRDGLARPPPRALGLKVAFTPLGVGVALTFIGLPFVVRTLQPVLEALDPEVERRRGASARAGPTPSLRVLLPAIAPAWLTGTALAFARALGEYGLGRLHLREHAAADRDRAPSSS